MQVRLFLCVLMLGLRVPAFATTLTGKVTGTDGKPIEGASVQVKEERIYEATIPVLTNTDATGHFTMEVDIPVTDETHRTVRFLTIYKPGYAVMGKMISPAANLSFQLERGNRVTGELKDRDGHPVTGVAIKLKELMLGQVHPYFNFLNIDPPVQDIFTARTDAHGFWAIDDLPSTGRAWFVVSDPNMFASDVWVNLAPHQVTAPDVMARPAAVVTGRILFDNGKPAVGIKVHTAHVYDGEGWAGAVTAQDGTYRLANLATSPLNIVAIDDSNEWVGKPAENVQAREGQTVRAPDIVLGRGAFIDGTVTDADTHVPLAGTDVASIVAEAYFTDTSNEKGQFHIRVPAGTNRVYTMMLPKGYTYPATGTPSEQVSILMHDGETKTVDFALPKALTIQGIAVNTDGKPTTGAFLSLRRSDGPGSVLDSETIGIVDTNGNWTISGMKPGQFDLVAKNDWIMNEPVHVTVPQTNSMRVVLKHIELGNAVGRVIDPGGAPIANAQVKVSIFASTGLESGESTEQTVVTDAAGAFSAGPTRFDNVVTVKVSKPGCILARAGKVSPDGQGFKVSDTVLLPLTGRVSGVVTDATGAPVAGATVFALASGPNALTASGLDGRFTLSSIPAGPVRLLVVAPGKIADVTTQAADIPKIVLREAAHQSIDENAKKTLIAAWTARRPQNETLYHNMLSEQDPLNALKKATANKVIGDHTDLSSILDNWIIKNPERAVRSAPDYLDLIPDASSRFYLTIKLGLAAMRTVPELAPDFYRQARDLMANVTEGGNLVFPNCELGKLAAALHRPEAHGLFERAVAAASHSSLHNADGRRPGLRTNGLLQTVVGAISESDLVYARQVASELTPREQASAFTEAAFDLVETNPEQAFRIFRLVRSLGTNSAQFGMDQLTLRLIESEGPANADAALELARAVQDPFWKSLALAQAATFAPHDRAVELLNEAVARCPDDTRGLARIGLYAEKVDVHLAGQILTRAAAAVDELIRSGKQADPSFQTPVPTVAVALETLDAAQARLLIERDWARQIETGARTVKGFVNDQSASLSNPNMERLLSAMTIVDFHRALELASEMDIDQPQSAVHQYSIIQYFVDPDVVKQELTSRY